MFLKVTVKAKHIKAGICEEPERCALALAILEQFPKAVKVEVDGDVIITDAKGHSTFFHGTKKANRFIERFDKNKNSVKPDVFQFREGETWNSNGDLI
jgi:hypothetical protein